MDYTFNGATKRITLSTGVVTLDLIDLHSRWKEWVLAGNAGFAQAFSTIGGETPKIPLYLFLSNGWKLIPQSANHTLVVMNGILETDDASEPFVDPAGSYSIRINREAPGIAIGYASSGIAGPSAETIAAAVVAALGDSTPVTTGAPTVAEITSGVLSALNATTIPVDMKKTNGITIIGTGSRLSPWRPA